MTVGRLFGALITPIADHVDAVVTIGAVVIVCVVLVAWVIHATS
jgi:hypothetical protein